MTKPTVRTRAEAAEAGLPRYFTGRMCKHGHTAERYVSSGTCVPCTAASQDRFRGARSSLGLAAHSFQVHPDDVPAVTELVDALTLARSLTP